MSFFHKSLSNDHEHFIISGISITIVKIEAIKLDINTYPTPMFLSYIDWINSEEELGQITIKNNKNPILNSMFISLMYANLKALFCCLNFANDIEEIASSPIIIANHFTYSGFSGYCIKFEISFDWRKIKPINIDEVVIDLGAAKGQNDPLIIHSKDAKNKSEKTSAA